MLHKEQGRTTSPFSSVERQGNRTEWEIKITLRTKGMSKRHLTERMNHLRADKINSTDQPYEMSLHNTSVSKNPDCVFVLSKMLERIDSHLLLYYTIGKTKELVVLEKQSIFHSFLPLFTEHTKIFSIVSSHTSCTTGYEYNLLIGIEKNREARVEEEMLNMFLSFGEEEFHLVEMKNFEMVRHNQICGGRSTVSWAIFCNSHDITYENLLNSTRGYINRLDSNSENGGGNVQLVVPIDIIPDEWTSFKSEELSKPYSFLALLFSLASVMSFSGLRVWIREFVHLSDAIESFHHFSILSKSFGQIIDLMSRNDERVGRLFSLWNDTGSIDMKLHPWMKYILKYQNTQSFNKMNEKGFKSMFQSSVAFPFRIFSSFPVDRSTSHSNKIDKTKAYKTVLFEVYNIAVCIFIENDQNYPLKELEFKKKGEFGFSKSRYNANNFSSTKLRNKTRKNTTTFASNDRRPYLNVDSDISTLVPPFMKMPPTLPYTKEIEGQKLEVMMISESLNNVDHFELDKKIYKSTMKIRNLMKSDTLQMFFAMNRLSNYPFECVNIPESLKGDIFVLDTLSALRYKNMIKRYRIVQSETFQTIDYSNQEMDSMKYCNDYWRPSMHFDFLLTFFEFLVLSLVKERDSYVHVPGTNRATVLHLVRLVENLSHIIECTIDSFLSPMEDTHIKITTQCNQDSLFSELIKNGLETKDVKHFVDTLCEECSLSNNSQLFSLISYYLPAFQSLTRVNSLS